MTNVSGGTITFDETGDTIGPATTATEAQGLRAFARARLHLAGDAARLSIDRCPIGGRPFNITLHFAGPRLARVELFMLQGTDGRTWDDWTRENELARKAAHEEWARGAFGRELAVKPYLMPEPIYPYEPGPEHPRHAEFAWGDVTSYYDDRAGCSSLIIDYRAP
jgi:hypothetical protein